MKRKLRRDIQLLKLWAFASTGILIASAATVLAQGQSGTRFDEINVERINIVERDGRVRLVLANSARQADAVVDGRVLSPGRNRPAGMIFFNDEGDEVGGLIFSGRTQGGQPRATASLTFDQWKQDQTVALQYVEQNGQRRAGLSVIDRPAASLARFVELTEKRRAADSDTERKTIDDAITSLGVPNIPRMFVGKDVEGAASLFLSDAQGRQRLVFRVESDGHASIRFLDASGRAVREIIP
jgi:hypothetical protein